MNVFILSDVDGNELFEVFAKEEDAWAAARSHAGFHEDEEHIKRWYSVEECEVQ